MAALFPELIVNGETVPQAVVAAEVQHHDAPKGKPGIAWRKAANAIAIRTLLLQEARRQGIKADPMAVGPDRFETDEEALIRGLLDRKLSASIPTEAEIRTEWERNQERFRAPPLWEVSHILCACDPRNESETAAAHARAQSVLEQVKTSPRAFSKIAAQHSDCGSKSSGGTLGQLGPGDTVPEFEKILRLLPEGRITHEPVLTRHGWHIIRMDAVAQGRKLPFETVQHHISEALEKAAWSVAARDYVDGLVASASISGADLKAETLDAE